MFDFSSSRSTRLPQLFTALATTGKRYQGARLAVIAAFFFHRNSWSARGRTSLVATLAEIVMVFHCSELFDGSNWTPDESSRCRYRTFANGKAGWPESRRIVQG